MGHTSAERSAVAHLRVTDQRRGPGQQRRVRRHERGANDVAVGRHRADHERGPVVANVDAGEARSREVDHHRWAGQAQLHERQERLTTGDHASVVAMLAEQLDCMIGSSCEQVSERHGDHDALPSATDCPEACAAAHCTDSTIIW